MPSDVTDACLYRDGVTLLSTGEYFRAHDLLEELWTETEGPDRDFLRGLIQTAVAFFQYGRDNFGAASRLCLQACKLLEPYQPVHAGLDVTTLIASTIDAFGPLLSASESANPSDLPSGIRPRVVWTDLPSERATAGEVTSTIGDDFSVPRDPSRTRQPGARHEQ